jgi:hypothetical protein
VPTGNERPSYDELAALVVQQAQVINELRVRVAALEAENVRLRAENAEVKRRLGMNSTNSSQPPSSDGLAKPVRRHPGTGPEHRHRAGSLLASGIDWFVIEYRSVGPGLVDDRDLNLQLGDLRRVLTW